MPPRSNNCLNCLKRDPQPAPVDREEDLGDFNDNANPLWSLYANKAENHDKAKIKTVTENMTDILLFAGLFAAALTPFIVDRVQTIQVTPAQQMVFYENQSVELLKQISSQLSSAFPQASVPSPSPLPPLSSLTANPSSSDIVINALWFTSLVLSLSAAVLATLVQRWARKHMQIFHLYKDPLKLSRIRQYLYEGIEKGRMPMIAEAVPALIHLALFLFFIGLADSLLHLELAVAIPAMCAIIIYFAVYGVATILPVFKPPFPLHNPFSVLIWFFLQAFHIKKYKDRNNREKKPVSQNMTDGQMELALEVNPTRKDRDRRSIAWLVGDITEDSEMEAFASTIPGSFDSKWGVEMWGERPSDGVPEANNKSLAITNYDLLYSSASHHRPLRVKNFQELCECIGGLAQTCYSPYLMDEANNKRSRICIGSAASLVFYMKADLSWFGNKKVLGKLLKDQGYGSNPKLLSGTSSSQAFAVNWTGLSIAITLKLLYEWTPGPAQAAYLEFGKSSDGAITLARDMDKQFKRLWDRVEDNPKPREVDIMHLEIIQRHVTRMEAPISILSTGIQKATYTLPDQFPWKELKEKTGTINACDFLLNPIVAQLNYLQKRFNVPIIPARPEPATQQGEQQGVQQGGQQGVGQGMQVDVGRDGVAFPRLHRPTERQIWRFQDLYEGSAVGFTLELYLLSLREIFSTSVSPPKEARGICVGALKNITSNLESNSNIWTQKVVLELICDIAAKRGVFSEFTYPSYIEDELVVLLRKVASGMRDLSDIERAREDVERAPVVATVRRGVELDFRKNVLDVLKNPSPIIILVKPPEPPKSRLSFSSPRRLTFV